MSRFQEFPSSWTGSSHFICALPSADIFEWNSLETCSNCCSLRTEDYPKTIRKYEKKTGNPCPEFLIEVFSERFFVSIPPSTKFDMYLECKIGAKSINKIVQLKSTPNQQEQRKLLRTSSVMGFWKFVKDHEREKNEIINIFGVFLASSEVVSKSTIHTYNNNDNL